MRLLLLLPALSLISAASGRSSTTTTSSSSSRKTINHVFFEPAKKMSTTESSDVLLQRLRGGQQQPDPYYGANDGASHPPPTQPSYRYTNYDDQQQQQGVIPDMMNTAGGIDDPNSEAADQLFHEAVQERVDQWKSIQQSKAAGVDDKQMLNPRDELGRVKLISTVSKGSRGLIFFVLMWRDIHLFEVADQRLKGLLRLMAVVPLTMLFIGNLSGVIGSLFMSGPSGSSGSHASKKRMKAILNLDKLVEILLLCVYFVRLTFFPSKYIPRELFIAGTLHSVFFLVQLQAFTRIGW